MDRRTKYLRILGLSPDATAQQVTEAYKDLMKVWHPDRFQNDERLLAKAQAMTQEINHAMAELRKLGKQPPQQEHKTSKRPPPRAPNFSGSTRSTNQQQESFSTHESHTSQHFKFTLSPLVIKIRFQSAVIRTLGGALALYLISLVLLEGYLPPLEQAAMVGLGFLAVDLTVMNLLLTVMPTPIITVNSSGIRLVSHGRLNWIDIESVYPVVTPRWQYLHITCSPHYLQKCSILRRIYYRLRSAFGRTHIQVGFSALQGSPVDVLDAMHLFQSNNQIELQEFLPTKRPLHTMCSFISWSTITISLFHCLLRDGLNSLELAAYFSLFCLTKSVQETSQLLRK